MTLRASVIIPTYGDWAGLRVCLNALAMQDIAQGRFEVVIGNNNPDPAIPSDLHLPPNARIIHAPKPGSYAARNGALQHASGDILFFTDADCAPARDWISTGIAAIEKGADRLAGYVDLQPTGSNWTVPELYDRIFHLRQQSYALNGYAATANLVARKAIFDKVGPFNDTLFSSGDRDWNKRATAAGYAISYAENVVVGHPARNSFASLATKRARLIEGKFRLRKHGGLSLIKPLKYLLPSLSRTGRILKEPAVTPAQKLRLLLLEYRLRLHEGATFARLRYGSGKPANRL